MLVQVMEAMAEDVDNIGEFKDVQEAVKRTTRRQTPNEPNQRANAPHTKKKQAPPEQPLSAHSATDDGAEAAKGEAHEEQGVEEGGDAASAAGESSSSSVSALSGSSPLGPCFIAPHTFR